MVLNSASTKHFRPRSCWTSVRAVCPSALRSVVVRALSRGTWPSSAADALHGPDKRAASMIRRCDVVGCRAHRHARCCGPAVDPWRTGVGRCVDPSGYLFADLSWTSPVCVTRARRQALPPLEREGFPDPACETLSPSIGETGIELRDSAAPGEKTTNSLSSSREDPRDMPDR